MKVIIGIDGSEGSIEAVRFTSRLLSAERDEIVLYYSPPRINVRSGPKLDSETLDRLTKTLTDAVFDKARCELPTALDVKTTTVIGTRPPKHGLLVVADECRADMIVVGARGSGPFKRMPLGSVGRAVVHLATVPVLIVRGISSAADADGFRVLFACDGSDVSKYACGAINKLTWPADTRGRVITVIDSGLVGTMPEWLEAHLRQTEAETGPEAANLMMHIDEQREHQHHEAARWCRELPDVFQSQTPIVTQGHASQEILEAIDAEKSDLVVVGSRGLGTLQRLFVGSTSEHLLAHAPCSILIARQHEKP